jgi:hypothetical protein
MAHTKPILALSSIGLGMALLLVTLSIQRDRFAFTTLDQQSSHALTSATFELGVLAPATPALPLTVQIPSVVIEALEVLPAMPRKARAPKPAVSTENAEPAPVVCNPRWRQLESGPAGRRVRDVC